MKIKSTFVAYIILNSLLFINGQLSPSIQFVTVLGFIICFYFSIFCISRFNNSNPTWKVLFVLILVRLFVFGGYETYMTVIELYGLPALSAHLLGIISGFFYFRLKNYLNILPFLLSSILVVFMFFQGWIYWIHYINFNTFTGRIEAHKLQQKVEGIDQYNNNISNQTLENKIVLLDFWHTKCGVCFQKFPQLQAFYDKYKDDDSIVVFAVNKPIEEDIQKSAFKVIEEEGYNFPVLLPTDEELPDKFGVFRFPATFVVNKQGNVVYKGGIEGAVLMVEELRKQ
jgi:thiol-disulfide isomerase/thioredoxin